MEPTAISIILAGLKRGARSDEEAAGLAEEADRLGILRDTASEEANPS